MVRTHMAPAEDRAHNPAIACGLYHTKFGVIRPPELWGDGKSLKKRRAAARNSAARAEDEYGGQNKRIKNELSMDESKLEPDGQEKAESGGIGEVHNLTDIFELQ